MPQRTERLGEERRGFAGALVLVVLGVILAAGLYLPHMPLEIDKKEWENDLFPPLIPTNNPKLLEEQLRSRDITRIARRLPNEYKNLIRRYEGLPPFQAPVDGHLSQTHIERYITLFEGMLDDYQAFHRHTLGESPGILRVFAWVGMVYDFVDVIKLRAFVNTSTTEDEFEWIKTRIMEAALFCVRYKLENEALTPEQRKHLTNMEGQLLILSRINELTDTGELIDHTAERLQPTLARVPRRNLELFLDNYQLIRYPGVSFNYPTNVQFDRDAILKAAAKNPP